MKKSVWTLLIIFLGGYVIFRWDYHVSEYLFEKYCSDPSKVGLFVYETVELPDEYFDPLPTKWVHHKDHDFDLRFSYGKRPLEKFFDGKNQTYKKGIHYRYSGGYRINKGRFEQDYILKDYRPNQLPRIGPINALETSVIRKRDSKVLGKAVSFANHRGWWARAWTWEGNSANKCPSGRDKNGLANFYKKHDQLISSIFYKGVK